MKRGETEKERQTKKIKIKMIEKRESKGNER